MNIPTNAASGAFPLRQLSGRWNGPLSCSKICWHSMVWCPGDGNLTMFDFNISTNGDGSKPWYLVNRKIAGKWMFSPIKMYL